MQNNFTEGPLKTAQTILATQNKLAVRDLGLKIKNIFI